MITFSCPHCGTNFRVKAEHAGQRSRCGRCRNVLIVPACPNPTADNRLVIAFSEAAPAVARPIKEEAIAQPVASDRPILDALPVSEPPPPPPPRLPMRTRRLMADAEQMKKAFTGFPLITIESMQGNPPDLYRIAYRIRSLTREAGGKLAYQDHHVAEIQLTSEYPRQSPKCKMLTPIFHPNIDPVAICVGDHWAASERLADLVIRIGELIAYQAYNLKSPLDGEAAMWTDLNKEHLPLDPKDLRPPNLD